MSLERFIDFSRITLLIIAKAKNFGSRDSALNYSAKQTYDLWRRNSTTGTAENYIIYIIEKDMA